MEVTVQWQEEGVTLQEATLTLEAPTAVATLKSEQLLSVFGIPIEKQVLRSVPTGRVLRNSQQLDEGCVLALSEEDILPVTIRWEERGTALGETARKGRLSFQKQCLSSLKHCLSSRSDRRVRAPGRRRGGPGGRVENRARGAL